MPPNPSPSRNWCNRKARKRMLFLKRRLSWLEARTAINENHSFDLEEVAVLKWVIEELTAVYPELATVIYEGDL